MIDNSLYWIVEQVFSKNTEIIYHIHTNKTELLSKERQHLGFENRGFAFGEINKDKNYKVFKKNIPTGYPITYINVGINLDNTANYFTPIQINKQF